MRYAKMPDEPPPPEQPSSASHSADTETGAGSSDDDHMGSDHNGESEDDEPRTDTEDPEKKYKNLWNKVQYFYILQRNVFLQVVFGFGFTC